MEKEKETTQVFEIKAYTKKELRLMYGIPQCAFRRWLIELPETKTPCMKNWLTAIQVEAIIRAYGVPGQKRFPKTEF